MGIKTWSASVACKGTSSPLYQGASSKQSALAVRSTFGVLDLCSESEVRSLPCTSVVQFDAVLSVAKQGVQDHVWLADWPARGADVAPSAAGDASMAAGVALRLPDIARPNEVSYACSHQ